MSVVVAKLSKEDFDYTVVFGTGGETIGGHLYPNVFKRCYEAGHWRSKIAGFKRDKGFIAPPVLCDINLDGCLDILANAVEGNTIAIDGRSDSIIWKNGIKNAEAYGSLLWDILTMTAYPIYLPLLPKVPGLIYKTQSKSCMMAKRGKLSFWIY